MTDSATLTTTIGGHPVTIARVTGRPYFRATALFFHTFGRALGSMLAGGGLVDAQGGLVTWGTLLGEVGPDGKRTGPLATEAGRDAIARLVGSVLSRFDDVDPDRLEALACVLIEGHVTIGGMPIPKVSACDVQLTGPSDYTQLVIAAIRHNLGPMFAGATTNAGGSPAGMSARPGGTRSARPRPGQSM